MTPQEMVREFHEAFGLPVRDNPGEAIPWKVRQLRVDLMREEYGEYMRAETDSGSLAEVAGELADILYIAYGTAVAYGIDLEAVFREVHRANMSKLEDGKPLYREDGKVLKGKDFRPADIAAVLGGEGPEPVEKEPDDETWREWSDEAWRW